MSRARLQLVPGPEHPITIEVSAAHVVVRAGDTLVAESDRALELREADYPPVLYVPLEDVDAALLAESAGHTYCPYKGEASYYDIVTGGAGRLGAAAWYYPQPYPAVARIAGTVAFYADRVEVAATPR